MVVLMEDAEHTEIGATIKLFLTVPTITFQHVSVQIVAKWLFVMPLLQMQDLQMLVCWFLTTFLHIVMMETSVHLICAIPMQLLQVLAITLLTVKQSSKRPSVPNTALVKLLVVLSTPVSILQLTAIILVCVLIMFVTLQPTTLALL